MYLKKIEINGFKSFAQRTSFDLSEGVTCFVGPNGCGKSNVVDAVKWGLGEQRVSSLRGDSMQDVIFKGNSRRPPMNFSEVSLIFENTCGTLAVDYDEVVVTRRLYRSGESEYLLNRTPCRLKDIRGLFLDTGIGVNAYSMMEQGRIDSILQANPLDRRAIFEEAAGISRYKVRRKEAERKLERTQANLLRVGDIIEELEKRIRSLKNQAGRARSYLVHSERLKALKRDHFLHLYRSLMEEGNAIQTRMEAGRLEAEGLHQNLNRNKKALTDQERDVDVFGRELAARKTRLAEIKVTLEERQSRMGFFEKRLTEFEGERSQQDHREAELNQILKEKEESLVEIRARFERLAREEDAATRNTERCTRQLREAEEACREGKAAAAQLESELLKCTAREVELKNKAVEAEARLKGAHSGLVRMAVRQNALAEELAHSGGSLAETERDLERSEKGLTLLVGELARGEAEARNVQQRLEGLAGEQRELESRLLKGESRMEVLQSLLDRREGVASGVKAVLTEAARKNSNFPFVKGMLAELLEVDVEHATALEAALGEIAEAVVVEDLNQARRLMDFVEEKQRGRVTILPLSEFADYRGSPDSPNGSLARKVACRLDGLRSVVNALLGQVHVIRREELINGARKGALRYVTLRGDQVDHLGILSVGGTQREPGVITRRSELAALAAESENLRKARSELEVRRGREEDGLTEMASRNKSLADRIEEQNREVAALRAGRAKLLDQWSRMRREYGLNALDAAELERSCQVLKERLKELDREQSAIEETQSSLIEKIESARSNAEERERVRSGLEEERRMLELDVTRLRERREGAEKESHIVEKTVEEGQRRLSDLERDRQRVAEMKADMEKQLRDLVSRTETLLHKRSELASELAVLESQEGEKRDALEARKADLSREEQILEEARKRMEDLRIEERGNQVKREALLEKGSEELSLNLEEALNAQPSQEPDGVDWKAVEQEIEEIKDRLSRMGSVNLEAINELQEVEGRYTSLVEQRDDLHQSIKALQALIADLNRDSREKFLATFEAVRGHFNEIFRKLFQGGKADLRLQEGEDVLESGIDVIAGPPGKDVQSINLLSGGEKTLTAVGLLFALFKSRPSPFCILDEVDAALDEVNIERFCALLGDYAADSQFIIVTHSKRTMSYCDNLYGITMEENGVSTRIALDLADYEEQIASN